MDLTTKMSVRWCTVVLCAIALLASSVACDTGLEPPRDTILSGTVTFVGGPDSWPSGDSLFDLRVAAFTSYPPDNIVIDVLQGRAWFTADSLPYNISSTEWTIVLPDPPPNSIKYLVVAQQFGPNFAEEWRAVGVYALTGERELPTEIRVTTGKTHTNLDIDVDFADLPPQPF